MRTTFAFALLIALAAPRAAYAQANVGRIDGTVLDENGYPLARVVVTARSRTQIGGPRVYTHLELVDLMARELGRRSKRKVPIYGATPGVVSAGAAIVTRGDQRIAAELTLSLAQDTIVTDPSGAEPFGIEAEPTPVALQRALEEEERQLEAPVPS